MSNLKDFLLPPVEEITKEVRPSSRFKTPFIIRSVTEEENAELKKANTKAKWNKKMGRTETDIDQNSYVADLMIKSITVPDLNAKEMQEHYKTLGSARQTLRKMLSAGEFNTLLDQIQEISGFDVSLEDLKDEAKKD